MSLLLYFFRLRRCCLSQAQFEEDFLKSKPTLRDYVERLQNWRDRYESLLNKRSKKANLESVSHWLVEFQYQKFDEIEVPGQYLKVRPEFSPRDFAILTPPPSTARGQQRPLRSHQPLCQQVRRHSVSRNLLPPPHDPRPRRERPPFRDPSPVGPHVASRGTHHAALPHAQLVRYFSFLPFIPSLLTLP